MQANKDLGERNMARIEKLEKEQKEFRELITAVELIAKEQKSMRDDIAEIKSDVKVGKEKSGKRWDALVEKVLLLVTSAVVGYILLQIGLPV